MIIRPANFQLYEFVCEHVFTTFGDMAWAFIDPRLLMTIDRVRIKIGKEITINNWHDGGQFSQRGLRCIQCQLIKDWCVAGEVHCDPHALGCAVDFDVDGLSASEIRLWLFKNADIWPYPIRLESDVNWVHLDCYDMNNNQKVYFFQTTKQNSQIIEPPKIA